MPVLQEHSGSGQPKEWIPENYEKVVSTMRKANIIKDYRMGHSVVRSDAFLGEDLVNLIIRETGSVMKH
ncbi:hypothetical protein AAVH_02134 [Aphelenchoides avenae]|nr:hypothetical protein AAVH_02134 [Aphelenchus avenae]